MPTEQEFYWGQLAELTKDQFVINLKNYFSSSDEWANEMINIEKFSIPTTDDEDPNITELTLIEQLPDIHQQLPLIAVTTIGGQQKRLGQGTQYVGVVEDPCYLIGIESEPFYLTAGMTFIVTTKSGTHTATFISEMFYDVTAASAYEVMRAICLQMLDICAYVTSDGRIKVSCIRGYDTLTIGAGTANAILGFTEGDSATYLDHPPRNRFQISETFTVHLDVVTSSEQLRRELVDALAAYFEFFMEESKWQWLGDEENTGYYDDDREQWMGEKWHIIFSEPLSRGAESDFPREGGDPGGKIFVQACTVPVIVTDMLDRTAYRVTEFTPVASIFTVD